jgi:hypothetical protein
MNTSNTMAFVNPAAQRAGAIGPGDESRSIVLTLILIAPWVELLWLLVYIHSR